VVEGWMSSTCVVRTTVFFEFHQYSSDEGGLLNLRVYVCGRGLELGLVLGLGRVEFEDGGGFTCMSILWLLAN